MSKSICILPVDLHELLFTHLSLNDQVHYATTNYNIYGIWKKFITRNLTMKELTFSFEEQVSFLNHSLVKKLKLDKLIYSRPIEFTVIGSIYESDGYYLQGQYQVVGKYHYFEESMNFSLIGVVVNNNTPSFISYQENLPNQGICSISYLMTDTSSVSRFLVENSFIVIYKKEANKRTFIDYCVNFESMNELLNCHPEIAYPSTKINVNNFIEQLGQSPNFRKRGLYFIENDIYYDIDNDGNILAKIRINPDSSLFNLKEQKDILPDSYEGYSYGYYINQIIHADL